MKHWDIFCKIIDNFGDIGVCWRLAKQLQSEHHLQVRLWVDDLNVAKQLIPALDISLPTQTIQQVTISRWDKNSDFNQTADVVIESFACELPAKYLANMAKEAIWINLEYLSAETWVENFHQGSSINQGVRRYFFFPGFTDATGGLLRESHLLNKRLREKIITLHGTHNALKVSLFCYPHAPVHSLLEAMATTNQAIDCFVPATSLLPKIAAFFAKDSLKAGDSATLGNLTLHVLPFLSQDDYDQLLAHCDINFVRGEDSWIRAIWAGKPFIWQPYQQSEETHLTKLAAFLDLFYADCQPEALDAVTGIHQAWTTNNFSLSDWQTYLSHLNDIKDFTAQRRNQLALQTDLSTNLLIFSEKITNPSIDYQGNT